MKKTHIVLIPVAFENARLVCNHIQETVYVDMARARVDIKNRLCETDEPDAFVQIYSMDEFMEEVNEDLLNFEGCFISYFKIEKL